MYRDIWYQLFLFFAFFTIGAVFALIYDMLKVSGRPVSGRSFFVVLKDVLFWLVVTVVMFAGCLKFNDGEFRFFMFVGVLLGALVYFKTISRFVVIVLGFIADCIKKTVTFMFGIFVFPLKLLLRIVNKPVFIAFSFTRKRLLKLIEKIKFRIKIFIKFKR